MCRITPFKLSSRSIEGKHRAVDSRTNSWEVRDEFDFDSESAQFRRGTSLSGRGRHAMAHNEIHL